jgi:hypothetical protein
MTLKSIDEIEKYFKLYHEGIYYSSFYDGKEEGRSFYHKKEDEFMIIIFQSREVYQLNSDHEIQGIELKTFRDLKTRFKSFTGENLEN